MLWWADLNLKAQVKIDITMGRARSPPGHPWWECKSVRPLWKSRTAAPQNIKKECSHPVQQSHFLEYIQRKWKTLTWKVFCTPMIIAALCTVAEMGTNLSLSMDERLKMHVYTMEYYSAIKNEGLLPFGTTWMDLQDSLLSGIHQIEVDRPCIISLRCAIFKRRESHRKKDESLAEQREKVEGGVLEDGGQAYTCPRATNTS